MPIHKVCLSVALLATLSSVAHSEFRAGREAYDRGDYAEAYTQWYPLAQKGHASAQYHVGQLLVEGRGVNKDAAEGASWYRRAADQADPGAQLALGELYAEGVGVSRDSAQAYLWCKLAVLQDLDQARGCVTAAKQALSRDEQRSAEAAVSEWAKARVEAVSKGKPFLAGIDGVSFPKRIASSYVSPKYPKRARKSRLEADVLVQGILGRDGAPRELKVSSCNRDSEWGFEETALEAVARWRYQPAAYLGQAVDVYFMVPVQFRLNH